MTETPLPFLLNRSDAAKVPTASLALAPLRGEGRTGPHAGEPDPSDYPRRIVLATLGLAPQVLTETLWCLARQVPAFVPTEIHVVTTLEGRRRAELTLLEPSSAMLAALAQDLGLPDLAAALTPERLHVIAGADGLGLADIDGMADNEAAADTIARLISDLTADPDSAVHVSIAGGRKTMGFLAGYALSLHGRPQDRLSHVLVGEPLQSHPQFYFPPRVPRVLIDRENRPVSTADARLVLADIPFVRLRAAIRPELLDARSSYSALVATMQARFEPVSLRIDAAAGRLFAQGIPVDLPPLTFVFAVALAQATIDGTGLSWRDLDADGFARLRSRLARARMAAGAWAVRGRLDDPDEHEPLFRQQMSRLRAAIKKALGPAAAAYVPVARGRRPNSRTYLPLPPDAIEIAGLGD